MSSVPDRRDGSRRPDGEAPPELREALCNEGRVGPAGLIQVPTERITRLNGLMLDLDPKLLAPDNPLFPPADDPRVFLEQIGPVLNRHPLLRHAEVRSSGVGLHLVLRLDPPAELTSSADQVRWAALVRAVQCSLPADPNAPGITALTRPIGSVNSRNGAVVARLRPGEPVDPDRVGAFVRELAGAPFRVVATTLLGADRVEPCPACRKDGSSLGVLDHAGSCYGCGKVGLERLFDVVYRPVGRDAAAPDAAGGDAVPTPTRAARKRALGERKPRKPVQKKARPSGRSATS